MDELAALLAELVAEAEEKNRRAANGMYAALVDIARGPSGMPRHIAEIVLGHRNRGDS